MNDNIMKQFKKGILELLILKLLSKKEMYGYELVSELNRRGQETLSVKEGTIYPILYRLEEDGLMQTRWEQSPAGVRPKKYYTVTEKGLLFLNESYMQWKHLTLTIVKIMEAENEN